MRDTANILKSSGIGSGPKAGGAIKEAIGRSSGPGETKATDPNGNPIGTPQEGETVENLLAFSNPSNYGATTSQAASEAQTEKIAKAILDPNDPLKGFTTGGEEAGIDRLGQIQDPNLKDTFAAALQQPGLAPNQAGGSFGQTQSPSAVNNQNSSSWANAGAAIKDWWTGGNSSSNNGGSSGGSIGGGYSGGGYGGGIPTTKPSLNPREQLFDSIKKALRANPDAHAQYETDGIGQNKHLDITIKGVYDDATLTAIVEAAEKAGFKDINAYAGENGIPVLELKGAGHGEDAENFRQKVQDITSRSPEERENLAKAEKAVDNIKEAVGKVQGFWAGLTGSTDAKTEAPKETVNAKSNEAPSSEEPVAGKDLVSALAKTVTSAVAGPAATEAAGKVVEATAIAAEKINELTEPKTPEVQNAEPADKKIEEETTVVEAPPEPPREEEKEQVADTVD